MKRKGILCTIGGLALILTLTACSKDDKALTNEEVVNIAANNATATDAYNDVYAEAEEVATIEQAANFAATSQQKSLVNGRSIAVSLGADTTLTITYNGYIGQNGRKKSGTIVIKQSGKMCEKNAKRTISLQSFTINDSILLEGTMVLSNLGLVNLKLTLELNIEDAKITNLNNGSYLSLKNTYTFTWDRGLNLSSILDDTFIIKGQGEGSSSSGFNYSIVIKDSNPLYMRPGCSWILQGEADIMVNDEKSATIDFGVGNCDNKFTITAGEIKKELESIKGN
jgi:hypothetical protein